MKNHRSTAAGVGVGALILSILIIWSQGDLWKPGRNDIRILNTSSHPHTVTAQLFGYFEDETPPWSWLWFHEFWLENRYEEDLDMRLDLQVANLEGEYRTTTTVDVTVPSKETKKVAIRGGFNTASKDVLPQRTYRIMARTQIERREGNEVKIYTFEWKLAEGGVDQTTKTMMPDKVPNELP